MYWLSILDACVSTLCAGGFADAMENRHNITENSGWFSFKKKQNRPNFRFSAHP